jgi:hypothetical protein
MSVSEKSKNLDSSGRVDISLLSKKAYELPGLGLGLSALDWFAALE